MMNCEKTILINNVETTVTLSEQYFYEGCSRHLDSCYKYIMLAKEEDETITRIYLKKRNVADENYYEMYVCVNGKKTTEVIDKKKAGDLILTFIKLSSALPLQYDIKLGTVGESV